MPGHGNCGILGADEGTIGGGVCEGVCGGLPAPFMKMLAKTIGGLGGVVVNAGNKLAAVGDVADPLAYCGCGYPATLGGLGAAGTTGVGKGAFPPIPACGGGNHPQPAEIHSVSPSGSDGGRLWPPATITGCGMPAIDGGTGAGVIGGSAIRRSVF